MKFKIFILLLLFFVNAKVIEGMPLFQNFDRQEFYDILKSGNLKDIDKEITLLSSGTIIDKNAYIGTLQMKKANMVPMPKEKLSLFKAGRIKLETALASDSSNVEYHFLRLITEEHAPAIVKYHLQIAGDSGYISTYFKKLTPLLQRIVFDYSKTSKILQPENIKFSE